MKALIFVLAIFLYISSCSESVTNDKVTYTSKTFTSNSSKVGLHNTMTITYVGNEVIAKRTSGKLDPNEPNDNIVFIEADVKTQRTPDGGIQVSKKNKNIWFIPFLVASDPIGLDPNYCWMYFCTCGGHPSYDATGCTVNETSSSIGCDQGLSGCASSCRGFAKKVICEQANNGEELADIYTGGVIVAAEKVRIQDPEGSGLHNQSKIMFYQAEDGRIMKLEDAKKANLLKVEK